MEVVLLTATFYPKNDGVCVSFSIFPSTADQNLNMVTWASLDPADESVHLADCKEQSSPAKLDNPPTSKLLCEKETDVWKGLFGPLPFLVSVKTASLFL